MYGRVKSLDLVKSIIEEEEKETLISLYILLRVNADIKRSLSSVG